MSKEVKTAKEQLRVLEKTVKKIIRKSLKNNTLDYTVQISISNLEPDQVKYAAQISSPAKGVQPITYSFNTFGDLQNALEASVQEINREQVELVFHQNMLTSLENRIRAHKERIKQIEDGEFEVDEEIELEEV